MARTRRMEITALNVLFCIIVIFIHIISYAVSSFPVNTLKYNMAMIPWRLSAFVVQGFILLSGVKLFLNGKDGLPYSKYLMSRLKGIILPYTICFAVYYICFMIEYNYTLDVGFIVKNFLLGTLACHFYFIVILVQFDLLLPLWKRIVNKCSPLIIIPAALIISMAMEYAPLLINSVFPDVNFIYNDRLFTTYLVYWVMGCYIGKNYDKFLNILKKNLKIISAIFVVMLVSVIYCSYIAFNQIVSMPYINVIHNLYVISVCIFLYALAVKIPGSFFEKVPLISQIDKVSFYIYLYHILVLLFANKIIRIMGLQANGPAFALRCIVVYTITPVACIFYDRFIKPRWLKSHQ